MEPNLVEQPDSLKVVITLKEDRVMIGVSATDCDPKLTPITLEREGFGARLTEITAHMERTVLEAMQQWAEAKRNPKYVKPKAAVAAATTGRGKAGKAGDLGPTDPGPVPPTGGIDPPADGVATPAVGATEESMDRAPDLPLLQAGQEATPEPVQEEQAAVPEAEAQESPEQAQEPPQEPLQAPPEDTEVPVAPTGQTPRAEGYYLKETGAGPFSTVHEALRALGVTQAEIDGHKWWHRLDRLPKKHADAIERVKA